MKWYLIVLCGLLAGCASYDGWDADGELVVELIEEETEDTVTPELRWLASVQNENGSWGKTPKWYKGNGHPGYTALALMAFLDHGETPLSQRYAMTVQNAMRWLGNYGVDKTRAGQVPRYPGSVAAKSHALVTWALCHSYSMTKIPFIQTAMEKTVLELVSAQLPNGGWAPGMDPKGKWDTELSIWCALALKDARIAGSVNPKLQTAMGRAKTFFTKTCRTEDGGFLVSQESPKKGRDALMVVATYAHFVLRGVTTEQDTQVLKTVIDKQRPLLTKSITDPEAWKRADIATMEAWLCASDIVLCLGRRDRKSAQLWRDTMEKALFARQSAGGYWEAPTPDGFEPGDGGGRLAATTLCTMAITFPIRYLPTLDKVLHDRFKSDSVKDGIDGDSDGIIIDIGE